jgi:hypothetical protein
LAETAWAPVEMPHWPARLNVRVLDAAKAGPPKPLGSMAFRVSSTRQGGTVK